MAGTITSGRLPKPTALHKLEGTRPQSRAKKRKGGQEPEPQGDLVDPPDWLTAGQRESWKYAIRHAPKGLLKHLDAGMLAAWCVAEDQLRTASIMQAALDGSQQLRMLLRTKTGHQVSPYLEIIDKAIQQMVKTSDRLGLSPAARPRIQIEPEAGGNNDQPAPDAWTQLRRFPVIDGGKAS